MAEVDGVRRGRIVAFSAPGRAGTEELHVVAEAARARAAPPERSSRPRVHRRCGARSGSRRHRDRSSRPGSLERTSSGKIKRRACAEAHRNGTLQVVRTRSHVLAHWLARERDLLVLRAGVVIRRAVATIGAVRASMPIGRDR